MANPEAKLLQFVDKQEKTSVNGKTYWSVKDQAGLFYSVWDATNAAMIEVGTEPVWWMVETKGKYHNIVGRGVAPNEMEGADPTPSATRESLTTQAQSSNVTPPRQSISPTASGLEVRKHALYCAALVAQNVPTDTKQFFALADQMLDWITVGETAPATKTEAPASAVPAQAVDSDLVPDKYIA